MTDYKAPITDIHFVRTELLDFDSHYAALPGCEEVNSELTDAILAEAAKFAEQVLAPLYQSADREGCHWSEQQVTTPNGFKQAYQQFIDGGWPALSAPEAWGGQGLPVSIDMMVTEIIGAANHAWAMYPILGNGARHTLLTHSTTELQQRLLPKLVSGHWTGTMCLTEPQGGSDLSNLHTKAEPLPDGSYKITGTKIFISSGDHDMAENIVHIVLARLPDAPAGTRGISLFAVPKYQVNEQGEAGESNHVICSAIEEKMGIHGNATCVLNFDGATGYLMGEPHQGLPCMFTFMNSARILIAMQGLSHTERALQCAWPYACERLAGRSLSGIKNPDGPADPLIAHADVRRMLFTIRSLAEGHRMLAHAMMQWVDQELYASDQQVRQQAADLLSFLTPITKGL